MSKKYRTPNGELFKIASQKIKNSKGKNTKKKRKASKNSFGKLSTSDRKNLSNGLFLLKGMVTSGFSEDRQKLAIGEQDVSKIHKCILVYRDLIERLVRTLANDAEDTYKIKKEIESLLDYSKITQAARDGVLIKQETRRENINGEQREVTFDTTMTPQEVLNILGDYEAKLDRVRFNKLNNYLSLGLASISSIGAVLKGSKEDNQDSRTSQLIPITVVAIGGLRLLKGVLNQEDIKKQDRLIDQRMGMEYDLLENEQISNRATESESQNIESLVLEEKELNTKIKNKELSFDTIIDLATALVSGMYINEKIQIKENGKIDGKSLALALASLQYTKGFAGLFLNIITKTINNKEEEMKLKELCKKVEEIMKQMEEKVYSLEGVKHPFDSMKITNFTGKFYPKKDYKTGEINYSTTIKVPEFSMKRGDTILLSGVSGSGKSTFLRFLKRGDINNRKAIELDDGEKVDNLGNEYISFRPSVELGNETNVLYQITGKSNISDLTEEERKNLITILRQLKFDFPNLLEQLASKKFMEFSTGQQKRLALSKVFYRINDGTSVIIVDEPVGNVEDSLIREQLEMIRKYAESRNVMLILTTHRLDLAQDLVTKRYHINEQGILEEIPIKKNKQIDESR